MIIDFSQMPTEVVENAMGGEKYLLRNIFIDDKVKILRGQLAPGASIGLHTHEINCEIMYFIDGQGKIFHENRYQTVKAGQCHYCPKGEAHSLINDSPQALTFFAVVPLLP